MLRFAAFPLAALALLPLPLAAQTEGPAPPEPSAWDCLTPDGHPAFAFSIDGDSHWADPEGRPGTFGVPEPGLIEFTGGIWAGRGGSFVPGIMALLLRDPANASGPLDNAPVICVPHRPG